MNRIFFLFILLNFIIFSKPEIFHPNVVISDITPSSIKEKLLVGGFDFFSDGRLAVCLWHKEGEVFIISNPFNKKRKVKLFARGLNEPLGLKIVNDEIYIAEKKQLTLLKDFNKDSIVDEYVNISNLWEASTNFHEFSFDLDYKKGKFYLALATPVLPGGNAPKTSVKSRGTLIEVNPVNGEYKIISEGFRTPNGIGKDKDGNLFVTDNQGSWLPVSKIVHAREGSFFGFKQWENKKRKEEAPVVFLPQNEAGNSPTDIIFLKNSIFKGQALFGDIFAGGLKRLFIEEVQGQKQGVVIPFSNPEYKININRLVYAPNNSILLGELGRSGNWGKPGARETGISELAFTNKNKSFEVLDVKIYKNGLLLNLTQPLKKGYGWDKNSYDVSQWTYKSTKNYGGPKINFAKVPIKRLSVSTNRKQIFLELDLKEGYVIHTEISKSLLSQDNRKFWSNKFWYTANKLPNYSWRKFNREPKNKFLEDKTKKLIAISQGKSLWQQSCQACHTINSNQSIGPSFLNLYGTYRVLSNNDVQLVDEKYIKESILFPDKKKISGYNTPMPALKFSEKNLNKIVLLLKDLKKVNVLSSNRIARGWVSLFDGKDIGKHWQLPKKSNWYIDNQNSIALHNSQYAKKHGLKRHYLVSRKVFKDFELQLEWKSGKINGIGNSGIFLRFRDSWKESIEVQVLNQKGSNKLHIAGAIYDLYPSSNKFLKMNDWNKVFIRVKGLRYQVWLNGKKTADFTVGSSDWEKRHKNSKFAKNKNYGRLLEGPIAFQDHSNALKFRNIFIRELK